MVAEAGLIKFTDFEGRASRAEYWVFNGTNAVVAVAFALLGVEYPWAMWGYLLFLLAVLCPCIAVSVRRLHDTNRSGSWLLLALIPFAGLALLVFFLEKGQPQPNKYGVPNGRNLRSS
ncbi:MAG: DUF805 domain-containing protein [Gemmatimonadetes bacterium]|nr:DUF805 domain-containing protein [Gemmatimonadota bacterium]MBT5141804.1 DUF805 domain-containing protein [Gemmatimonadota bacterium]MBT5877161.1 DUF805 domain-containing protein [Candidatus Latescibacterota bacterium]